MKKFSLSIFVLILIVISFCFSKKIQVKVENGVLVNSASGNLLPIKQWLNAKLKVNDNSIKTYFPNTMMQFQCQELITTLSSCIKAYIKDILVCTQSMVYWFVIKSNIEDRREIKTGGGMLNGMWEVIQIRKKIKDVYTNVFVPKSYPNYNSNTCAYFNLLSQNGGIQLLGTYNLQGKPISGIIFSNALSSSYETSNSGMSLLATNNGNYSNTGLKLEFIGNIMTQKPFFENNYEITSFSNLTQGVFSKSEDTDPSKEGGVTKYTLTYRIPIDKSEISFRLEMNFIPDIVGKGSMPIYQVGINVNYNDKFTTDIKVQNKNIEYSVVSYPELIVNTSKEAEFNKSSSTDLNVVEVNRDFKDSSVSDIYFYNMLNSKNEFFSVKSRIGRSQVVGIGSSKFGIPYLLCFPDNDVLSDESIDNYSYSITKSNSGINLEYNLLGKNPSNLTEDQVFILGEKLKIVDTIQQENSK